MSDPNPWTMDTGHDCPLNKECFLLVWSQSKDYGPKSQTFYNWNTSPRSIPIHGLWKLVKIFNLNDSSSRLLLYISLGFRIHTNMGLIPEYTIILYNHNLIILVNIHVIISQPSWDYTQFPCDYIIITIYHNMFSYELIKLQLWYHSSSMPSAFRRWDDSSHVTTRL